LRGEDVVVRPNVVGALALREIFSHTLLILLVPESLEQLSRQLQKRGTDSAHEIATRVSVAPVELSHLHRFDYVVENRDRKLAQTVSRIKDIILAEKRKAEGLLASCHSPSLFLHPVMHPCRNAQRKEEEGESALVDKTRGDLDPDRVLAWRREEHDRRRAFFCPGASRVEEASDPPRRLDQ
jgi:hypothetical protein